MNVSLVAKCYKLTTVIHSRDTFTSNTKQIITITKTILMQEDC